MEESHLHLKSSIPSDSQLIVDFGVKHFFSAAFGAFAPSKNVREKGILGKIDNTGEQR